MTIERELEDAVAERDELRGEVLELRRRLDATAEQCGWLERENGRLRGTLEAMRAAAQERWRQHG